MDLTPHEEKLLKIIQDLGPDYVCNQLFQDSKSQAALATLIHRRLIKPDFTAKDEMVDQFMSGGVINRDDFDLRFSLTELGLEYADHIYIPNRLFSGKLFISGVIFMLAAMIGIALWLL